MSKSVRSPYRRPFFGLLAVCLAALTWVAAGRQGWFDSQPADEKKSASHRRAPGDVPPPDEGLFELPPEERDPSTAESIADRPRKGRRFDVVTAGFEDDAPEVPQTDDEPALIRDQEKSDEPVGDGEKIAGRPPVNALGAAGPNSDTPETEESRRTPLVDQERIDELIATDRLLEAQKELSKWYWRRPAERDRLLPQLNRLSKSLFFSPQPHFINPYVVKSGDQLRVIGQKHKVSWEYLAKLNHVDPKKIRAGQKLKMFQGPFSAFVVLDKFELTVHVDGVFVKRYRVGVGKDGTTPVGTFPVKNKMVDPTYYGPDGVIAHDDPANPLGERWIDIGDSFGIHGTIEPDSIGKKESRGCVRMLNSDVEEVYDFLIVGSQVKIIRQ